MNYKIKINLLFPFLFMSSPLSHAVVAGGTVSIVHLFPSNAEFNKLSFFQQINNDGGKDSNYYWANQFSFKGGDAGYIGLQNRKGNVHAFNFSIWKATGWRSDNCSFFDHEGSGVQCQIIVPWKTGHQYKLDITKDGNTVTGMVTDQMDGTTTTVGVIEVPNSFGKIYNSSGFVEEFSQGNDQLSSCYVMGTQSSIFRNPVGDDNVVTKQLSFTYGNCNDAYVAQTSCNNDSCINTISNLGAIASPDAPTVSIINGSDLAADTLSDALSKVDLIAIRASEGNWAPNIYFPKADLLKWKSIFLDNRGNQSFLLHVDDNVTEINNRQQVMYTSDGTSWKIINAK